MVVLGSSRSTDFGHTYATILNMFELSATGRRPWQGRISVVSWSFGSFHGLLGLIMILSWSPCLLKQNRRRPWKDCEKTMGRPKRLRGDWDTTTGDHGKTQKTMGRPWEDPKDWEATEIRLILIIMIIIMISSQSFHHSHCWITWKDHQKGRENWDRQQSLHVIL